MKNTKQKGFTIVELVIVIAVIAILAAVLIPTFSNIIKKANLSNDIQTAKNLSTEISLYKADIGIDEITKEVELKNAIINYHGEEYWNKLTPKTNNLGYHYFFDYTKQTMVLSKINEEPVGDNKIDNKAVIFVNGLNNIFNKLLPKVSAEEINNNTITTYKGDNLLINNTLRCLIKDGYYLCDQTGDSINQACSLLDNLNESVTCINDFNKAWDIINSLDIDTYKNKTTIINTMKQVVFITEKYAFVHPDYVNQANLTFEFANNLQHFRASKLVIYQENELQEVLNVSNINTNIDITLPSTIKSIDTNAILFDENSDIDNQVKIIYKGTEDIKEVIKAGTTNVLIVDNNDNTNYKVTGNNLLNNTTNTQEELELNVSETSVLVEFKNYDDTLLYSVYCLKGEMPKYNAEIPTQPETLENKYTFDGWLDNNNEEIKEISFDLKENKITYFAHYEVSPNKKFESILVNSDKYTYRVGNMNTVSLKYIYKQKENIPVDNTKVNVSINPLNGANITCQFIRNEDDWKESTIQFTGSGEIELTINEDNKCPETVRLEIVEAMNVTEWFSATTYNVCLLNNIGTSIYSGSINVENGYSVYGNGYKITCYGDGNRLNTNGMGEGFVNVRSGGTLDNVLIIAPIYPKGLLYAEEVRAASNLSPSTEGDRKRYMYQWSAVAITGNSTISNSYIYGGRNNIYVGDGNITLENNVLECGVLSNIEMESNEQYTVVLRNMTTIQHKVQDDFNKGTTLLGTGIIGGTEKYTNPIISIQGDLTMYNWACSDDSNYVGNTYAKQAINTAVNKAEFQHTYNSKTYINSGIVFLNGNDIHIDDQRTNKNDFTTASLSSNFRVYSQKANTGEVKLMDEYQYEPCKNNKYESQFKFNTVCFNDSQVTKFYIKSHTCKNAIYNVQFDLGYTINISINDIVDIYRYSNNSDKNISYKLSSIYEENINIQNNEIISISDPGTYYLDIEVSIDNVITKGRIQFNVEVVDRNIKNAEFVFNTNTQKWIESGSSNIRQSIAFLGGLKIYDFIGDESTKYLRFDGDDTSYSKIAYLDLSDLNKNTDKASQNPSVGGDHIIKVVLIDGGVIEINLYAKADTGSSTYSLSVNTLNNILYAKNGGTTGGRGSTWTVFNYKFTGNNGTEITSAGQTFTKGSSYGNPSGSFNRTKKYTVTYDANGGTSYQQLSYSTSASSSVVLPNAKNGNMNLAGWFTEEEGGSLIGVAGASYTPTQDITLYAHWTNPTEILFDANDGSCDITLLEQCSGSKIELPIATTQEYKWLYGWSDGTKEYKLGEEYIVPSSNAILTAIWKDKYDVEFDVVDSDTELIPMLTYSGSSLELPLPISSNKTISFVGWYSDSAFNSLIGMNGTEYTPTNDVTLFAKWVFLKTITYDPNEGNVNPTSFEYDGVKVWNLPTPTRSGYWFVGWYLGEEKIDNTYKVTEDMTLVAKWSPEYTVSFNANEGDAVSSMTYKGNALTLPTPTRTGYTFNGWFVGDNNISSPYTPNENIKLTAKWTINTHKVTLSLSNASGSISYKDTTVSNNGDSITNVPYGATITLKCTNFSKDNNKTIKWTNGTFEANLDQEYTFTMPDKDVKVEMSSSDGGCLGPNTLVSMADGTQKNISEIKLGDIVKSYNFETGEIVCNPVVSFEKTTNKLCYNLFIELENGRSINLVNYHGLFDMNKREYFVINNNNALDYIGTEIMVFEENNFYSSKIKNIVINEMIQDYYSIITGYDFNVICDDILTVNPLITNTNLFEINEEYQYDIDKMNKDIELYGVSSYDLWKNYMTYEQYELTNFKYINILLKKGNYTIEYVLDWLLKSNKEIINDIFE